MATLLFNDSDPDNDSFRMIAFEDAAHGTVDCDTDDAICVYTPDPTYEGLDSFEYTITDDKGGYDTTTVTVTVRKNGPPDAVDDTIVEVNTRNGWSRVVSNDLDPDGDALRVIRYGEATHGAVQCQTSRPSSRSTEPFKWCSYTLDPDYAGTYPVEDEFDVRVSDGKSGTDVATVHVTVNENQPPVAVDDDVTARGTARLFLDLLGNDRDPDGDPIALVGISSDRVGCTSSAGPTCFYTPPEPPGGTYPFEDEFTYTITDGFEGHDATATVTVTVVANSAPVARPDSALGALRPGRRGQCPRATTRTSTATSSPSSASRPPRTARPRARGRLGSSRAPARTRPTRATRAPTRSRTRSPTGRGTRRRRSSTSPLARRTSRWTRSDDPVSVFGVGTRRSTCS